MALAVWGVLAPTAHAAPYPDSSTNPPAAAATAPPEPQLVASASDKGAAAAPADAPAPDPGATATTGQSDSSGATATQQQPTNVVVIVRVNSPGDDGSVTQNNLTVGASAAANDSSTGQWAGDYPTPATQQMSPTPTPQPASSATGQQAASTATATQDAAGNLVVTVRIDSPGRNGDVTQTNSVAAGSSATNTSGTAQQAAAPEQAVRPQARREGAANSQKPKRRDRHPTATAPAPAPVESISAAPATTADVEPGAPATDRAATRPAPAHRLPVARLHSAGRAHPVPALSRIAGGAAQALAGMVPRALPAADPVRPEDVSRVVLLTLLTLAVVAAATFVAVHPLPPWRGTASWRRR
jgi:hypothetical protein